MTARRPLRPVAAIEGLDLFALTEGEREEVFAELRALAEDVRERAWAPYSKYRVGAALVTATGRVFTGCNVENATYGATTCAERGAVQAMVAAGERRVAGIAIATGGEEPGAPCGICRQVLREFAHDLPIELFALADGEPRTRAKRSAILRTSLAELLPRSFGPEMLLGEGPATPPTAPVTAPRTAKKSKK